MTIWTHMAECLLSRWYHTTAKYELPPSREGGSKVPGSKRHTRLMQRENIDVVRAFFDAWNAGDMEAVRELHDPNVIQRPPGNWPEPGPFVGREAVMHQYEELRGAWETDTLEPISEFVDAGDRVVVSHRWHGIGRGPDSTGEYTGVWTIRNQRIFHQEFFSSLKEALEAIGLSDQGTRSDT